MTWKACISCTITPPFTYSVCKALSPDNVSAQISSMKFPFSLLVKIREKKMAALSCGL